MAKFSIIIPVYNVEAFLPACLDSVYSQNYKDFEVILVDDATPDNAGKICDEYKEKYPENTVVIHQENTGAGGARNRGLTVATGDYIYFVDSDDTITEGSLEKIADAIDKDNPDFVYIASNNVDLEGRVLSVNRNPDYEDGRLYKMEENPAVLITVANPWDRIIRRDIIEKSGVLFPTKVFYEDIRTMTKWVVLCSSFVYISEPVYNYTLRPGSTMNSSKVMRNGEIIDAMQDIIGWFTEKGMLEKYRSEVDFLVIDHVLVSATVRVLRTESKKHPLIKQFRDFTLENVQTVKENKYFPVMPKNRKTVLNLLLKNMYLPVIVIFRYIKKH